MPTTGRAAMRSTRSTPTPRSSFRSRRPRRRGRGPSPATTCSTCSSSIRTPSLTHSVGTAMLTCVFNFGQQAECEETLQLNGGTLFASGPADFNSTVRHPGRDGRWRQLPRSARADLDLGRRPSPLQARGALRHRVRVGEPRRGDLPGGPPAAGSARSANGPQASVIIQARREARTRSRSPPSRPPSRWSIVASSPPATKIHASATGSRSAWRTPSCLAAPDHVGEEVVHLADLLAQRLGDHRVLRGLGQRLDPEVDEAELRPLRHVGVGDRPEAAGRVRRRAPPRRTRGTCARPRRGRRGRGRASSRSGGRGSAR